MAKVGDVTEIPGETKFEWKIEDFFSLSDEKTTHYDSPKFYFSGTSWEIRVYPNDKRNGESEGWISFNLTRMSSSCSITVEYTLGLRNVNGITVSDKHFRSPFHGKGYRAEILKFMKRATLIEKKCELAPKNDLTVVCTMKNTEPIVVQRSLFRRLQDISDNLREVYLKKKRTDFRLKFKEGNIPANRMILETRSPVFEAMLKHDTKENQTGEVSVEDTDINAMHNLLLHIYSGEIDIVTKETALSLYAAADKYDIKDVKEICLDYIIRNLSIDWVFDVMQFADLYQEEEVSRRSREYFKENADEILESETWRTFASENHNLSVELLGSLVKTLLPLRKNTEK